MTDSPAWRNPVDAAEQPILDALLGIRDKLLLLKADKSKYVKSQDVIAYYNQVLEQTAKLNDIRVSRPNEQNRLDNVLDDCYQLISLFFLTIGRNNEAPAAYSVTSTAKRLLDHLKEAGFYSHKDLNGIKAHLERTRKFVERDRDQQSPQLLTLLDARIHQCELTLNELLVPLSNLSEEMEKLYEKLVSILRTLSGLNTKSKFPVEEVKEFQRQLQEIDRNLEGQPTALPPSDESPEQRYLEKVRHISMDASTTADGRDIVLTLLARCLLWAEIVLNRQGKLDERFRDTFTTLLGIRNQLDKLAMTQAWSLRETDLYGYQRKLDRFDEAREDGNFVDADGKPADLYEQRTLLYLLRKSYAQIYIMIASSEPVSEALLPVYNQLMTLRKCLVEVRRSGGVSSPRELYPYSMKLNSIDNMRHDGKFVINGDIPEGQGSVTDLLAECFEMAYELRNEAESEQEVRVPDPKDDDANEEGDKPSTIGQVTGSTEAIGVN